MKIAHIIIGLNIGGAELFLYRLINRSRSEVDHVVISLTELGPIGKLLRSEGVLVICLDLKNLFSIPSVIFKLYSNLKVLKPDVVHTWMYHADFLGGIVAKSLNIKKIIWSVRTTDVTLGKSRSTVLLRKVCAHLSYFVPTHIIYVAYRSKDIHIEAGYDALKAIVINNGFELDKLHVSAADRSKFRCSINVRDDEVLVGSIGRFNSIKNQKKFVEVAHSLVQENIALKFVMIGRDNDSDNEKLMNWISDRGLQKYFILLGQRSDIFKCIKGIDIFCLHSKTEGFPNVLGEAMAIGTLCISLDVGDAAFLLNNSELIAKNDNLSNLIKEVVDWPSDKKNQVILQSIQRIRNEFSISVTAQSYIDVYNS